MSGIVAKRITLKNFFWVSTMKSGIDFDFLSRSPPQCLSVKKVFPVLRIFAANAF